MATEGPLSPSAASNIAGANIDWSNPTNVYAQEGSYAHVTLANSSQQSDLLRITGFSASIPSTDVIDGVLFEVDYTSAGGPGGRLNSIQLVHSGSAIGSSKGPISGGVPYQSAGGATDVWGATLTPAIINDSSFGVQFIADSTSGSSREVRVDHVRITIYHTTSNTAPDITSVPTVSYGSLTRTGPENTPVVVSFTATDAEQDGADELNWGIYTATAGGGTQVASGTCTSGVQEQVNIAYNASGISAGSNTLYLLVDDGTDDDEESFTLLRDDVAPVTFTPVSDPSPATTRFYAVELTAEDATSTGTDELTYQIRTGAGGTGSVLRSGTRTSSGTAFTTPQFFDPALVDGSNTRYARVIDGAGNVREVSFTVTGSNLPEPVIADAPVSRPRMTTADLITIDIYRPLGRYINGTRTPVDTIDINPSVTAISWSSVLPGGWSEAMVGIAHPHHDDRYGEPPRRPWLPRDMTFGPFYHVEIKRHGRILFAGRMGPQERTYGRLTGFRAQGYGIVATQDMYYRNTSETSVASGTLLRAVIAATAPHLRAAPPGENWQDPGNAHQYVEFHRMYLGDVLDQIAAEGDSAGNLMDWMVFEDQVITLTARREPTTPDYVVPWSMVPSYTSDPTSMIGIASYERLADSGLFTPGGPTTSSTDYSSTDTTFAQEHGFQRGEMLTLGRITQSAAIAITRAYLEWHSRPAVSAAIEAGPEDRLTDAYGRLVPREEVRAGQWVQIEGEERPLLIMSTDYDAFSDVVRVQAGEFVPDFSTMMAALERARLAHERQVNVRGGRAR